jgi:hypothetical protein
MGILRGTPARSLPYVAVSTDATFSSGHRSWCQGSVVPPNGLTGEGQRAQVLGIGLFSVDSMRAGGLTSGCFCTFKAKVAERGLASQLTAALEERNTAACALA